MKSVAKALVVSKKTLSILRHVTISASTKYADLKSDAPPSSAYYDDLISAAGRRRDFSEVRRHLENRMKDGFFNTANTFKFIANAATDDPSVLLDELTQTLAQIDGEGEGHVFLNTAGFHKFIANAADDDPSVLALAQIDGGFARKSSYDALIICLCKLHRTADALRVAEDMISRNYGANSVTFHPILIALTKKKEMEKAWHVVEFMREKKIPLDLTAYNYILTGYCSVGDLTAAAGMLIKMAEEGLGADSRTYDALVLGACKAGKVEGAMVVLRRMEDDKVPVLYSTHVHVINALLKLGHYAQAVEFVMSYGGRERALDRENFGILANRLIELKRIDEATVVVKEMSRMGLKMESTKLRTFYELHIAEK